MFQWSIRISEYIVCSGLKRVPLKLQIRLIHFYSEFTLHHIKALKFPVLIQRSLVYIIGLCHQEREFNQAFIIISTNGHL